MDEMTWDEFHERVAKAYKKIFQNAPLEIFGMRDQIDFDSRHGIAKKRAEQKPIDSFFEELEVRSLGGRNGD